MDLKSPLRRVMKLSALKLKRQGWKATDNVMQKIYLTLRCLQSISVGSPVFNINKLNTLTTLNNFHYWSDYIMIYRLSKLIYLIIWWYIYLYRVSRYCT